MKTVAKEAAALFVVFALCGTASGAVAIGAAPPGDAGVVAARIVKYNFPECKRVQGAVRQSNGTIRASCDGVQYLVFTMYSSAKGQMLELALNCTAAKKHGIDC